MQSRFDTFKKNAKARSQGLPRPAFSQPQRAGLNILGDVTDEEIDRFYEMRPDWTYVHYRVGSYEPIEDVYKEVKVIRQYAVNEHKKQAQ
ncbi:hypothetical protein Sjap_023209 [Stephania japonica]|uniref:Uncharacterized protein n=1 Tax=Stephania japonica TaxID=461633 RepID=A0AAP0EFU3_9MAGN